MDYFEEINNLGNAVLVELKEIRANSLALIIQFTKTLNEEEYLSISGKDFGPVKRIFTNDTCPRFEIYFKRYVAYNVLTETYIGSNEYDEGTGGAFCIYSKSKYLNYINENTGVFLYDNEELSHYGVFCSDHVIDIVSVEKPTITRIN